MPMTTKELYDLICKMDLKLDSIQTDITNLKIGAAAIQTKSSFEDTLAVRTEDKNRWNTQLKVTLFFSTVGAFIGTCGLLLTTAHVLFHWGG